MSIFPSKSNAAATVRDYNTASASTMPFAPRGGEAPQVGFAPSYEPVLDWQRVAGHLWDARTLILLAGVLGLALAALYAAVLPNQYIATSELLLDPHNLRIVQDDVRQSDSSTSADDTYAEDQARILASPELLRGVMRQENLASDPEFTGGHGLVDKVYGLLGLVGDYDDIARREAEAMDVLQHDVTVSRSARSLVVDVSVKTRDADKSARLSNAIVAAYFVREAQVRYARMDRAGGEMKKRLEDLSTRVQQSESEVAAFRRDSGIVAAGKGQDLTEDQVSSMSLLLTSAKGRTAEARSRRLALQAISADAPLKGTIADQVRSTNLGTLLLQVATLREQAAELDAQLGPRHPSVQSLHARLLQVRDDVHAELKRQIANAVSDEQQAQRSEADLQRQLDDLKHQSYAVDDRSVRLRELQREADANKAIYENFLLRSQEANELKTVDASNTRVISDAVAPFRKAGPERIMIAAVGAVLGLLLGSLLSLVGPSRRERPMLSSDP